MGVKLKRRDIVKLVTCKICECSMNKPKCLNCMHSFCESCLSAYIIKLVESEGKSLHCFKCPSCQADNKIPDTSLPIESWVRLFSPSAIVTFLLEKMSLENPQIQKCDPCKRGDDTLDAMSWCKDCGEALCENCASYHTKVKMLMDHTIVTLDEMRKQPKQISDTDELCSQHGGKYVEAFCDDHDAICCVECVTENHRQCKTVRTLEQASLGIKTRLDPLVYRINELEKQAVSVVEDRKTNMDDLLKQKEDILTEVNKTRTDMQSYFETLETKLKEDIVQTHESLSEELQLQAQSFQHIFNNCDNGKRVLTASVDYGSDRDIFLTAFKLRKQCELHEIYIRSQSEKILRHDYSLHMNEIIKTFTDQIKSMGNVSIEQKPTNIVPTFYKDMHVSVIANMSGKSWSDTGHCWFTGGIFLQGGLIVMADYRNRKLKCFNTTYTMTNELVLEDNPWDVCFLESDELEGDTMLVTFPNDSNAKVVKIDSGGKMVLQDDEYEIGSGGHGLHRNGDRIYIACSNEIRMLSLKTKSISTMPVGNRGARYVLSTKASSICYSTKASVTCHDRKGQEIFRYKDPELRSPRGIAEDAEGNIYVCGIDSNNVHQLLPDGTFVKIALSGKDDIYNPYAILFQQNSTRFIVTQMDSDIVKVYELITMW
ncbi:uncharacterized protein LOC143080170 [Mytilus galloprovincialis]|uniref:uncharacterized protein LOC143080170 n=1 Tax=Mytilus galloprovincialis TaxID=29158 RepID=UPI003F7BA57B